MTHPSERKPVPVQLAACCPEAQADGAQALAHFMRNFATRNG